MVQGKAFDSSCWTCFYLCGHRTVSLKHKLYAHVPTPHQVRLMAKEHLGRYRNSWDCLAQVGGPAPACGVPVGCGAEEYTMDVS